MRRLFSGSRAAVAWPAGVVFVWIVGLVRFRGWIATDDHAILQLELERIAHGRIPLTGAYSRLGIRHPGPLREWGLGAAYWLTGGRAAALPATALALNVTSAGVAVVAARRLGGMRHAAAAAAGVALAVVGLRGDLYSPWNPHLAVLAGWAAVWAAAAAVRHTGWVRPVAVVWLSLAAQLHAAFLPIGAVGLAVVLACWWRSTPVHSRWQPAAITIACWLGPLLDLRHGGQANLVRILLDSDGDRIGVVRGARHVAHLLLPWSLAAGDLRRPGGAPPPMLAAAVAVAVLAAVGAGLAVLVRRTRGADRTAAGAALVALVVALASAALFVEPLYPYLFAPLAAALLAPTAAGVGTLITNVPGEPRDGARHVMVVIVAVAVVAGAVALVRAEPATTSPVERGLRGALAAHIVPGRAYAIDATGMEVVTYAQVALYVEQLGGRPYSAIGALDLDLAPDGADVLLTAMNAPLECLDGAAPSPLARDLNTFSGKPVGVFSVSANELSALEETCPIDAFRTR